MNIDIARLIVLYLPWQKVYAVNLQLTNDRYWRQRAIAEFPVEGQTTFIGYNSFFDYLAARSRWLQKFDPDNSELKSLQELLEHQLTNSFELTCKYVEPLVRYNDVSQLLTKFQPFDLIISKDHAFNTVAICFFTADALNIVLANQLPFKFNQFLQQTGLTTMSACICYMIPPHRFPKLASTCSPTIVSRSNLVGSDQLLTGEILISLL